MVLATSDAASITGTLMNGNSSINAISAQFARLDSARPSLLLAPRAVPGGPAIDFDRPNRSCATGAAFSRFPARNQIGSRKFMGIGLTFDPFGKNLPGISV